MKIIHTSDIHLDSPLTTRLSSDRIKSRKRELIDTFARGVEYARAEGAQGYIIAGDLFDSESASRDTVEAVLGIMERSPEITFFYLFGNHEKRMLTESGVRFPRNLKIFNDGWTYFNLDGVTVAGRAVTESNMFGSLELSPEKKNIVVLHGELCDRSGADGAIGKKELGELPIDYLALGHYHTYSSTAIGTRCVAVYSGTPEGRGFDEVGYKGVVLVSVDRYGVSHEFVKTAKRTLHAVEVDISELVRGVDVERAVEDAVADIVAADMVRVIFTGEREPEFSVNIDSILARFKGKFYYLEAKDATRVRINAEKYKNDRTLKGEFIRTVLADGSLSDGEKERVIVMGLRALLGESID
ncbi:MAG: DNA repair exonuclease [Clostridia bacterium]|nr:DNA repair exonuclease [Clostridia bacterium]